MERVTRVGISLEEELLRKFDAYIHRKGYTNRSQALRDLVREKLVEEEWRDGEAETVATVNIVYDHHKRELLDTLAELQHGHLDQIVSTLHVHLDHEHCLEILVLRGRAYDLRALGDKLIATRGVLHGTMSFGTTGQSLA